MANPIGRPLPQATEATAPFWNATREQRLLIQKCEDCGRLQFYPRLFCTQCLSENRGWIQSKGEGSIYTYSVNHRAANEYMRSRLPYVVAVATLDEGVRMMGIVENCQPSEPYVGARIRVVFTPFDDLFLPGFALIRDEAAPA